MIDKADLIVSGSILCILLSGLIAVSAGPTTGFIYEEPVASNQSGNSAIKIRDKAPDINQEEEAGKNGRSCGIPGRAEQSTLILTVLSVSGLLYLARKNK